MSTNSTNRPRRQRKGDRLINIDANKAEVATDHAVAPFDRVAREMEQRWGIDRLPELVEPEMAAKYGGAIAYLNECIAAADPEKTAHAAANCIRGLYAMDEAAKAAGHKPPELIGEYQMPDGFKFGIVADIPDWSAINRPDLKIYSLREIGAVLQAYLGNGFVQDVRKHFPAAEVKSVSARSQESADLNDPIPF